MKRSDIIDITKEKNLLNMIFEGNEKVYFFFSATKKISSAFNKCSP